MGQQKPMECKPMPPGRGGWSEWTEPVMKGYMMQCCDCGLIHEMQFKVLQKIGDTGPDGTWPAKEIKNGRVSFRARRKRNRGRQT